MALMLIADMITKLAELSEERDCSETGQTPLYTLNKLYFASIAGYE